MKINGQKINHKKAKRLYLYQCRWFGVKPKTDYQLAKMSTREIFQEGKRQFDSMPKNLQEGFYKRITGQKSKPSLWDRVKALFTKRFMRRKLANA